MKQVEQKNVAFKKQSIGLVKPNNRYISPLISSGKLIVGKEENKYVDKINFFPEQFSNCNCE